jgi:hypothetical protein
LHEPAQSGSGIDLVKDFSEVAREKLRAFTGCNDERAELSAPLDALRAS